MSKRNLERMLAEAGFERRELTRHTKWVHPSGVWTMMSKGSKQSEKRRDRTIRCAIRKAQRI